MGATGGTEIIDAIDVFWRPGCPFCLVLLPRLRRSGVPLREHNIWADPAAAARVRAMAGGNETVPSVLVGSVGLVNPSGGLVMAEVRRSAPHLAPAPSASGDMRVPLIVVLVFVTLWAVLAALTPTTTYHLAPVLVAGAAPLAHRLSLRTNAGLGVPLALSTIGLLAASLVSVALSAAGLLGGTVILAGGSSLQEALVLSVVGSFGAFALVSIGSRTNRAGNNNP